MYEYENMRRVIYPDKSGYYGDANKTIRVSEAGLKKEPNGKCSKCGDIEMPFEGFF